MTEVSIQRLQHLASEFSGAGGNTETGLLLRACGVPTSTMSDPNGRITIRQEAEFVRRACDALGDPLFAARAGLAYRDAATLTAYVARSCETLGQAIEHALRYLALADSDTVLQLTELDGAPFFSLRSRSGTLDRFFRHREFLAFALVARLRRIAGASFVPAGLAFRHDIRSHRKAMERLAGCRIHVECAETGIWLTSAALNLPISTADPVLRTHLSQLGEGLLAKSFQEDRPLSEQVEAALIESLPGRLPSAEAIAARVGVSRRTMTRKLTASGNPYRAILDRVRRDLACRWLRDTYSISEIAFLLDYADQAAFTTAFKRWTGTTPNAFRNSL